ncbi:MAG: chemotaxis protein CheC, partial [Lachnospiraceae bacterium]|nr:chemotaxis protein CheC [Lachnospiraceae bacterium]
MDGMLSQEEINALFSGMDIEEESATDTSAAGTSGELLTPEEKDAIGEISNISLGSSATTLFALVNQRVNISTPTVSVCKWDDLSQQYERPCVFIQISYREGLDGKNVLILQEKDVKIIADLMMGGDGS